MTAQLDIATLAQLSCLLEVSAPKPGNVCPGMRFRDMSYEDFLVSALAIGPAIGEAGKVPLGITIERALAATREVTRANTNLGLVLLLTPAGGCLNSDGRYPQRAGAAGASGYHNRRRPAGVQRHSKRQPRRDGQGFRLKTWESSPR